MTRPITPPNPHAPTRSTPPDASTMNPQTAATPLHQVVLSLLIPLLMAGGLTDPALAGLAAQEAITAHTADGRGQLVTTAQIVAFALASLDNLRLSADPGLSLSMKLKLRGNANALCGSAQRRSAPAAAPQIAAPPPEPDDTAAQSHANAQALAEAQALAGLEQAQSLVRQAEAIPETVVATNPVAERPRQFGWAGAMTDVAAECARDLANLPPSNARLKLFASAP